MRGSGKIITIGLCPSWDTFCRFEGIGWGGVSVKAGDSNVRQQQGHRAKRSSNPTTKSRFIVRIDVG